MLLVAAIFKGAQNAINALKSDIHVQYMVNGAKLQMQGILSKSDTLATLVGKIGGILKCVEGSFTAEAMTYLEQHLTAEKGSRFLETMRKLEKELGDKKQSSTLQRPNESWKAWMMARAWMMWWRS